MYAAKYGHLGMVKKLLDKSASMYIKFIIEPIGGLGKHAYTFLSNCTSLVPWPIIKIGMEKDGHHMTDIMVFIAAIT